MIQLAPYIITMMLLASLFVLLPVWRYRGQVQADQSELRKRQNITLFEQSVNELDENLAAGLIEPDEYHKLKLELERNFLSDMESEGKGRRSLLSGYSRLIPLALVLVIPVGSYLFYRAVGSGQELILPELIAQVASETTTAEAQLAALTEIAAVLDQRFDRRGDIQTGYTLGTLYTTLEQFGDAVRVFTRLADSLEETADKAAVLGQLAQAQYLQAGSVVTPEVQATMDAALDINANEQAVMSILAVEALQNGDLPAASNYWRRQISQLPVGSAQVAQLNERVAAIEAYLAEEQGELVQNAGPSITVRVDIDESIRDQIEPGMRVFVFARGEGPPVAAENFDPSQLPVTVTLDDSDAMLPQFTLSSADTVYVGASIARQAVAESGDFQILSDTFNPDEQEATIELVIRDRIP